MPRSFCLSFEDEVFAEEEVDEEGDNGVGGEGEGGHHAEVMDEKVGQRNANDGADAGDDIKVKDFADAVVAAGFEDPEDVDEVGGEIREDEGQDVVDGVIAGADGIGDETGVDVQEFGDGVVGGERRHKHQGAGVEQDDMDDGGDAAGDGVFDELDEWSVRASGELLQQVPDAALVFDL